MSIRSARTLTLSRAPDSRYSSSLSCSPVEASAAKAASALPNRVPNVRHSQRGMMPASDGVAGVVSLSTIVILLRCPPTRAQTACRYLAAKVIVSPLAAVRVSVEPEIA